MSNESYKTRTPLEILEAALEKEKSSHHFYNSLLSESTVTIVHEVIEQLRDEEYKHIFMIEKMIARMQNK
jgi:rubrerythrin